jgi:hypothetical protein
MASPNLSEVVTTTLQNRSYKLADNVLKNNALLNRLKGKGNVKPVPGGRTIVQELEYAENGTYTRYAGYDAISIAPSDTFTAAEFDWKQAAVTVSISGLEQLMNSGPDAVIDLLESRIKNAEKTMMNNVAIDCYSDGTASGSKQIGGLQLLVADSPSTGTVGGINRATFSFWRSLSVSTTFTAAAIQAGLNSAYAQTVRGKDQVDLWVGDNTAWIAYLGSLQAIQRITASADTAASAGFQSLKFMGGDFVLDGGFGNEAPASHVYGLNTDYIYFRPHKDRNMVPLDPDRFSTNQDAMIKIIGFAGNMTLSNAFLQVVCH